MITPPLRYPGGKSRAMDKILSLVPNDFKEYRESFLGGGSIFLGMKQKFGDDKKYWINDLYKDLYIFWNVLQKSPDNMINLLLTWKKNYKDGKMLQQYLRMNRYKFSDLEYACSYLVLNRTSFSGIEGGFSALSYEQNFTVDIIRHLKDIANLLRNNTKITNLDYEQVLMSKPMFTDEDVYTILDPPYFTATNLYGRKGGLHKAFDHERFARIMKNINETTKYRFLITYDDSNKIRQLFEWANIVPWELVYTSRNPKMGKEIFIANYDIESMIEESKNNISKTKNKFNGKDNSQKDIESSWGM